MSQVKDIPFALNCQRNTVFSVLRDQTLALVKFPPLSTVLVLVTVAGSLIFRVALLLGLVVLLIPLVLLKNLLLVLLFQVWLLLIVVVFVLLRVFVIVHLFLLVVHGILLERQLLFVLTAWFTRL